jgi:hypothetical protein
LEKSIGGGLQHVVLGCGDGDLGELDDVRVYAGNLRRGIGRDIAAAIVFTSLVDFLVAELGEAGRGENLGCAVAVAGEDLE